MQTILGSGGIIGVELAKVLPSFTDNIRLVSRNPQAVNANDELFKADLMLSEDVLNAVQGSDVCYLTVGLKYDTKVWTKDWPVVMRNVIEACKKHDSKLIFFDNIYMYDSNYLNGADENTPINPSSKKGKIRAQIADMLLEEVKAGNLTASIARCADFYGPRIKKNGILREMIFNKLADGQKADWLCSVDFKHSATYTPDAARATAMLGNTEDSYGEVWHLPTASNPLTGKEWINLIAEELDVKPQYRVAPKFLVKVMGLFMPIMKELVEMLYQYDRDYIFNSDKFEQKFDFTPTPYAEGIKEVVRSDFSK